MSTISTLRAAIGAAMTEAKTRTLGVLDAIEEAFVEFIGTVTEATETAAVVIVSTVFNLAETVVDSAFSVAEAAVDAVLGREPGDGVNPSDEEEVD